MTISHESALNNSSQQTVTPECGANTCLLSKKEVSTDRKVCAQTATPGKPPVRSAADDPTGIRIDFEISIKMLKSILKYIIELMKKIIGDCPPTPDTWEKAESTYEKLAYCHKYRDYKKRKLSTLLLKAIAEILYSYRNKLIPIDSPFDDDKGKLPKEEIFNLEVWVGKGDTAFNTTDYNTIAEVFGWAENEAAMIRLAMAAIVMLYLRECEGITELDAYIHSRGSKKYASMHLNLKRSQQTDDADKEWRIPCNSIKLPNLIYSDNCLVKHCITPVLIKNDKELLENLPLPAFGSGFRRLVEVFCRSCIIALRNLDQFDEIICNDADYKVINYFYVLGRYTQKLAEQIRRMVAECIRLMLNSAKGTSKEATDYIKGCREINRRSMVEQKIIAAAAFFILVNFSRQCSEKNLFSPNTFIKKADEELDKMINHMTYTSRFLDCIKFTNYDFRRVIRKYDSEVTTFISDQPYIRGFGVGCEDYSDGKNKKLIFSEKDTEDVFCLPKHAACILFHSDKYKIANLANKYGYRLAGVYRTPNASYDTNVYTKNIPDDYNIWSLPAKKEKFVSLTANKVSPVRLSNQ